MSNLIYFLVLFSLTEIGSGDIASETTPKSEKPPHIIVIMADDLGWNDVGYHGSAQIPTPNIDALAYSGVQLHAHITPPLCTPSRATFLTGKYPTHTGMQHIVILEPEPWGLSLEEKLLPELLRERGYATHAIGKWHLGFHRANYTPTRRGFDSHFGYWNGFQDYYDHSVEATFDASLRGYDMRRGLNTDFSSRGQYSTNLFTSEAVRVIHDHNTTSPLFLYLAHLAPHTGNRRDPLQSPPKPHPGTESITDPQRQVYAAMVAELDRGVGAVIKALKDRDMLQDSFVLFFSDNGAPTLGVHANRGSNYPLRGQKHGPWEGGSRTASVVWSARLAAAAPRLHTAPAHVADWLPTLYRAAGGDPTTLPVMDGVDLWRALHEGKPARSELLYNIDESVPETAYAAMRRGRWKLVNGSSNDGRYDGWIGESGSGSNYDWDAVVNSSVALAIADVSIRFDLNRAKKIREAATIKCPKILNKTAAATGCEPKKAPCLFDLDADPCETVNLAQLRPHILKSMMQRLDEYRNTAVSPRNVPSDPNADPAKWGGVWASWIDALDNDTTTVNNDLKPIENDSTPKVVALTKRHSHGNDHWDYVVIAVACAGVIMLAIGLYAWKNKPVEEIEEIQMEEMMEVDEVSDICKSSLSRRRGEQVARKIQMFEQKGEASPSSGRLLMSERHINISSVHSIPDLGLKRRSSGVNMENS